MITEHPTGPFRDRHLDEVVDLLYAAEVPRASQRIAQVEGATPKPSPRSK